jgi:hypothetical protein
VAAIAVSIFAVAVFKTHQKRFWYEFRYLFKCSEICAETPIWPDRLFEVSCQERIEHLHIATGSDTISLAQIIGVS